MLLKTQKASIKRILFDRQIDDVADEFGRRPRIVHDWLLFKGDDDAEFKKLSETDKAFIGGRLLQMLNQQLAEIQHGAGITYNCKLTKDSMLEAFQKGEIDGKTLLAWLRQMPRKADLPHYEDEDHSEEESKPKCGKVREVKPQKPVTKINYDGEVYKVTKDELNARCLIRDNGRHADEKLFITITLSTTRPKRHDKQF